MMVNNCFENTSLVVPAFGPIYIFHTYLQDTYMMAHSTQPNPQLLANHLLYLA
jgi:hypothetical protein